MKKFIINVIIVICPIILTNLLFGMLRIKNGDNTIPYKQNWLNQFITHNQIEGKIGVAISDSQTFDMSRKVRHVKLTRYLDKWGFQNVHEIKDPEILFIGDSFFDDPFLSYEDGLSYKFPNSMNIGFIGCSGFAVYNELKKHGYFNRVPKVIILEVVERNLVYWSSLFRQIENNEMKTTPYCYAGFDLVFGNNFERADFHNLSLLSSKTIPRTQGVLRNIGNKNIYFYNNKISQYENKTLQNIYDNMKKSSQHFNNKGCRLIFLVVPDKESIFPEIFPKSNLPQIQKSFDTLGVEYIDMYHAIMQSPQRQEYYFEGDTHWNQNAYNLLIDKIKTLTYSQNIIFKNSQTSRGTN